MVELKWCIAVLQWFGKGKFQIIQPPTTIALLGLVTQYQTGCCNSKFFLKTDYLCCCPIPIRHLYGQHFFGKCLIAHFKGDRITKVRTTRKGRRKDHVMVWVNGQVTERIGVGTGSTDRK